MLTLTQDNFVDTVTNNDTVFVDLWADWCMPCRMFGPVYEKVAEANPDAVFAKLDTDANQQLSAQLGVQGIPTVMAFRGGVLVFNQSGAMNEAQFTELVNAVKALDVDEVKKQAEEQAAANS